MKLEKEIKGEIVVLTPSGRIMGGDDPTIFHSAVHKLLDEGYRQFVIDMSKVDFMNSMGLGVLISTLTTIKNRGGHMKIVHTDKIRSLLTITSLITVFDPAESVDDALEAFEKKT